MSKLQEGQIIIPKSRLSYPKLFRAQAIPGEGEDKARFGCNILLPKSDTATKAKIDAEIQRICKERNDGVPPKGKDISMKDGDGEYGDDFSKGCWIISANRYPSQGRPQVVDANRTPLTEDDGRPMAGDVCNYCVGIYMPKKWKGKICFSLEIVQFVEKGEAIGGGTADVDVMPDMGGDEFGI